jgi:hypothetical protein
MELPQRRPRSHEEALMQPQSFFWPGVQDPPAATAGENAPVEPLTGGGGNVNIPATADVAGAPRPDPTGEGAEAKAAAGTFTKDVSVGLQGEVKTAAAGFAGSGALTANATVIQAPKEPLEPDAATLAAGTQQRPAAYRFGLRDGKIDVLPEPPEPEDREFALDTYRELVAKVRELHERLQGTNSARRVGNSIERLLMALAPGFDDLRPGVLLSRSRSLEADRVAFGDELLPDIIAMMDDAARTLRDLLASFPIVRRIEAEVLALDLDRSADAVPALREQMAIITAAAEKSEAITPAVIGALTHNDAAIEEATDPVVQRRLIADNLQVFRNFVSAIIREIADYGGVALAKARAELGKLAEKSWEEINNQLPKSIGATGALVPPLALVGLAVWLTDPVTAVAVIVPTFEPIAKTLRSFGRAEKPTKTKKKHPK